MLLDTYYEASLFTFHCSLQDRQSANSFDRRSLNLITLLVSATTPFITWALASRTALALSSPSTASSTGGSLSLLWWWSHKSKVN
jgi:hypothetical protein